MSCAGNNETILKTLKQIEQKQKEIILEEGLISCDTCLIGAKYNTIPVTLYLCSGLPFEAKLHAFTSETTNLYRVEDVINCETVKLRLIEFEEQEDSCSPEFICSNQTVLVNLGCICCVQCFSPINCESCSI